VDATAALRRTPLYRAHAEAGARLVEFAGWEMPVQYEGVRPEHLAVRERCGAFDVSHMGQIETAGPAAAALLQRLLSNDVAALEVGGAQYSLLCREDGGVLDDLFTYRLEPERYLTVTNAANHARDLAWFRDRAADFDAEVADRIGDYAMVAVQGPRARGIAAGLFAGELPARLRTAALPAGAWGGGAEALVCGTGYTGEDGVEVLIEPGLAVALWDALLAAGAAPAGLAARDTLRLEACFCLYGNELTEERNPIEAGLGWACAEGTEFIGADAVARARADGIAERLVAFALTERGVPRQGNPVLARGEPAGGVTSGTFSPSLERGIGMAYVGSGLAEPGTEVEIDVRGKRRAARIERAPLVAPAR
jgi:aminomethyltransferase